MQALGNPWDELLIADVALPAPKAGVLRIRVESTDLNFADILQCQGRYQVRLDPPFTPGMNAAGTIIDTGDDCGDFRVGERVIGPTLDIWGGYAEESMIRASLAFRIPDGLSTLHASATHITHGTAWFALHHRGRLQPGETVLVLAGAGGVGSAAIQMAKAHGCWVLAAAGGPAKTRMCLDLGADAAIDYRSEDLYRRVRELTDNRGVDVAYDPVGGEHFESVRRLLAWEGRLLIVGFASGEIPSAPTNHALVKNYSIVGVHMGGYRTEDPASLRRCYADVHQQLIEEKLKPVISDVVGFDTLPQALERLSSRGTTGRVMFDPAT
jgi:NADPH2:quinone reductase